MGKVDNNIVEIETNFENKLKNFGLSYKMLYLLFQIKKVRQLLRLKMKEQAFIFMQNVLKKLIHLYRWKTFLNSMKKKSLFEIEKQKLVDENIDMKLSNSKFFVLKDEIDFQKKLLLLLKI